MLNESCIITDILECDCLYQVTYNRKCKNCDYQEIKDRKFVQVLKNGCTQDIDNWHCPKCNILNITKITVDK